MHILTMNTRPVRLKLNSSTIFNGYAAKCSLVMPRSG